MLTEVGTVVMVVIVGEVAVGVVCLRVVVIGALIGVAVVVVVVVVGGGGGGGGGGGVVAVVVVAIASLPGSVAVSEQLHQS